VSSEGDIKAVVLKRLAALEALGKCIVIRQQSGSRGGGRMRLAKSGTPDLQVLVGNGRSVWLELKKPGTKLGKTSSNPKTIAAQNAWHLAAEKLKHNVWVVDSVDDAMFAVNDAIEAAMGLPSPAEKEKATL
jgi:hypothetical protein